jgi:hypothetical protein
MAGRTMTVVAGVALSVTAIASTVWGQETVSPAPEVEKFVDAVRPSAMGPVCWAAIVESIRQIGTRCFAGENPDLMSELDRSNEALGAMFLERGWTPEQLEGFRRQMGEADEPAELLCSNEEAIQMYNGFASADRADLAKVTEEMLARPGPPEWGSCL